MELIRSLQSNFIYLHLNIYGIMVVVFVARLALISSDSLEIKIKKQSCNIIAEDFANKSRVAFEKLYCEFHPNVTQRLTIIPDLQARLTIEKDFCCDEFSTKIPLQKIILFE